LSTEYAGKAAVYKVDIEQDGDLAGKYGIMSIPALLVFKDGKVVDQMVGAGPKERIAAMLDRAIK
jgi:thioredoxin 1